MAKEYIDINTIKFLLHDVHNAGEVTQHEYYSHLDESSFDLMIDSARQIANREFFPYLKELDRFGTELENGKVVAHPQARRTMEVFGENGFIGMTHPLELGGQQVPETVGVATGLIFTAANNTLPAYPGLTNGAANIIAAFASPELKNEYLPNMYAGKWQGTMCLTEPQAGSSLSDVQTTASPQPDGTYKIKGHKIFITAGDYDIDNVVNMVLARIDGAPAGTKGISLFLVPRKRKDAEGNYTIDNDIVVNGVYHKMGQKGAPACHLVFGDRNDSIGWLIGEPNKGLSYMFKMMNEARIGVGVTGAAIASAAYHAALEYAQERPQGRSLNNRDLNAPQTFIINHPDVRRMLLTQKAIVEGSFSLLFEAAKLADLAHVAEGKDRENLNLMLELLTPVAKVFPTEQGIRSTSNAVQCFGGYGYTDDFPAEQLYRDIRITSLYEGTTGILSMALLGREITRNMGASVQLFLAELNKCIEEASTYEELKPYASELRVEIGRLQDTTMKLVQIALTGNHDRFVADATLYMEWFGLVCIGWQWLKMSIAAKRALLTGNTNASPEFYEAKIHTMKFFFGYELPRSLGLAHTLNAQLTITMPLERELVS
jgi:butyryl-CoA dehydrogenase